MGAVALTAGALSWILPVAISEVAANREELVGNANALWSSISERLPSGWRRAAGNIPALLQRNSERILSGVAAGLVTAGQVVSGLLLALVLTFFFLRDGGQLARRAFARLSDEKRAVFEPALERVWTTLRGWIRGAALIALADALGIGIGLALLGVPLALPLALLTFIAAFIPVLGATAAGAVAVLVAWATGGTTDALIALAIVVGVQQLEGNVLEPIVMGRLVPLHPATILVAVAAGAILAGVPGAFAAVPLTAAAAAFVREVYRRSEPSSGRGARRAWKVEAVEERPQPH